jgi:hypothetical protein
VTFNSITFIPNFVEIGKLVQQVIMKTHSFDLVRIYISLRKKRRRKDVVKQTR